MFVFCLPMCMLSAIETKVHGLPHVPRLFGLGYDGGPDGFGKGPNGAGGAGGDPNLLFLISASVDSLLQAVAKASLTVVLSSGRA